MKENARNAGFDKLFRQELGMQTQTAAATESRSAYALPTNALQNAQPYQSQYARPPYQQASGYRPGGAYQSQNNFNRFFG